MAKLRVLTQDDLDDIVRFGPSRGISWLAHYLDRGHGTIRHHLKRFGVDWYRAKPGEFRVARKARTSTTASKGEH